MDAPNLSHLKIPDHIVQSKFGGVAPKGLAKFQTLSDMSNDFPELIMLEQFLTGFLKGSAFGGSQCNAALQGLIYYGFEVIQYREIYLPKNVMKANIAIQKLQEAAGLFSA